MVLNAAQGTNSTEKVSKNAYVSLAESTYEVSYAH